MFCKPLEIGSLKPHFPIIQGGMGVGVSLHNLAGHVAKCGGIGIISGAQIGYRESDFSQNPLAANLRALKQEIQLAKKIAPKGIIGVNLMVAMKHYGEMVKEAIQSGAELIISGAGLPLDLPGFVSNCFTKLVPIVSSSKAAYIICKRWDATHSCAPDALVVEGPLAGGHLGFKEGELQSPKNILDILKEVKTVVEPYALKYNKHIPIIVAGGFYSGKDVARALKSGADGVQMATRFVTTTECDAPLSYKETYIQAQKEDIVITKSPVGLPGRAIKNAFLKNPPGNNRCIYHCLNKCSVVDIPYCISQALIAAVDNRPSCGLLFCGSNAYQATHIETVAEIFKEINLSLLE